MRYSYVPEIWLTSEIKSAYPDWETRRRVRDGQIVEFAFDGDQPECLSKFAICTERQEDS